MANSLSTINTQHLIRKLVTKMTHITISSKREIVVVATLANPIACSLMGPLGIAWFAAIGAGIFE